MGDQAIQGEVILGVDTHLDAHVGVVISGTGTRLGTLEVPADIAGYLKLLTWAVTFGRKQRELLCQATGADSASSARISGYNSRTM